MATLTTLERKAARLLDQADSRRKPKTLVFCLEAGDELTREQRARIGPYDQVIIEEIPHNYFGLEAGRLSA